MENGDTDAPPDSANEPILAATTPAPAQFARLYTLEILHLQDIRSYVLFRTR